MICRILQVEEFRSKYLLPSVTSTDLSFKMTKGFRPSLVPPADRHVNLEERRPWLCVGLSVGVTLLVFVIFGMSCWNVYEHRFSKNMVSLQSGDEVAMNEMSSDMSSTFCSAYKLEIKSGEGTAYFLPVHAVVNKTNVDIRNISMHLNTELEFNVRSFYLLEGSTIDVAACKNYDISERENAEIILIKGADNFKKWHKNRFCQSCTLQRVSVPKCKEENHEKNSGKLNQTIHSNDYYYLVLFCKVTSKRYMREPIISLNGSYARTHFSVENAEKQCILPSETECQFYLPWQSEKDVVVKFQDRKDTTEEQLFTQCQPRLIFWICLFGILPVICVIPASILFACFLCRKTQRNFLSIQKQVNKRCHKETDREIIIENETIPEQNDGMTIQDQ